MIYFLYGKDIIKSRKKLHDLLDWAKKKRPDAELFKINTENWSESQLEELLVSQGLFDQKYTVFLDNLFENKEIKAYIVSKLEDISSSEQLFFMLEKDVDAVSLKKIEKSAKQVQEFKKVEEKENTFNIFAVANGLISRDKKKLWVSYVESIKKGIAPEEIHGIFFWQIKNMILASRGKSQKETGLSPFVYKNALTGGRNYKTEELITLSNSLVQMTHSVRRGKGSMDIMLEKWVLSV